MCTPENIGNLERYMDNLHDKSPTDLLDLLQDGAPALDPRVRERLKNGIEALFTENRELATRAVRAEAERDALLTARGRRGLVYDADDEPVRPEELREEVLESRRFVIRDRGYGDIHIAVFASSIARQDAAGEGRTRHRLEGVNTLFVSPGDIVGREQPNRTVLHGTRPGLETPGMAPAGATGRKCYELIGRIGPCTVCAANRALASGRREVVGMFAPEIGRYLECRSSPVLGPEGEVTFIVEQLYDITDRKRTGKEVPEDDAAARAPEEMIVLLDLDGRVIGANEATTRRLALFREGFVGKNLSGLFPPDVAGMHLARLHGVAGSGRPERFEDAWEGRVYDAVFYPIRDVSGAVTRVVVIARDTTGKRQATDALRKLAHDLNERVKELSVLHEVSRIIEQSGDSLDEIFSRVARVLPSGWQYPEDTVAGIMVYGRRFETERFRETPWRQASPVVVHGETVGRVEVCLLHEQPEKDEGPFLREERSLLDTVARRLGRAIERIQATESLQRSESQFREITQQSFDMIYTCYSNGGIAYISPAVIRILGYTPDELIGARCRDYIVPSSLPLWDEGRERIAAGKPVEGLEVEFRRKDGSAVFLELSESPIVRERSVIGVHGVGRDISERKQNEQLRQRAFEQIERNIEQFAVLGDHIRQPLQVILGMTELLDEGAATDRISEQVERINGYVRQLDQGWIESRQVREFLRKHELA